MDFITGIQKAIDYIEENLTEELDYEKIAVHALMSSFHFQRVFAILCGFPLGEYIRSRRMTLAGAELNSGKAKVIDVALKYGYGSPDSFAKAFTRFHGITPSCAREPGASLKSFGRLSIKIALEGGSIMDYRIEKKPAFKVIGKARMFDNLEELLKNEVPAYWEKCYEDGTVKALYEFSQDTKYKGMIFGICYADNQMNTKKVRYSIASAYEKDNIPDGYTAIEIPEYTWAIFKCVGAMPRAIQDLWKRIYKEYFPTADYTPVHGIDLEVYYEGDMDSENYVSEIWIPVERI